MELIRKTSLYFEKSVSLDLTVVCHLINLKLKTLRKWCNIYSLSTTVP